MIRTYLDWILDVPWNKVTEDRLDPVEARRVLDEDHYDLDKVKERIVEYLAVQKLRNKRTADEGTTAPLQIIPTIRHSHRQKHLLPLRQRFIGRMPEREVGARVERDVVAEQAQGVKAIGAGGHSRDRRCLQLSSDRVVERVAEACRAVVAIVVVAVELVLW